MLNTYDRTWTYAGPPIAIASFSLAWYARYGAFPVVSETRATDAVRVAAAYWGLLVAAFGLVCKV